MQRSSTFIEASSKGGGPSNRAFSLLRSSIECRKYSLIRSYSRNIYGLILEEETIWKGAQETKEQQKQELSLPDQNTSRTSSGPKYLPKKYHTEEFHLRSPRGGRPSPGCPGGCGNSSRARTTGGSIR